MKTNLVALCVGLAIIGCRQPSKPDRSVTSTAMHAVHNAKLKGIMERLAMLPAERLPQELDVAREQVWRREDAERLLGEMAGAADAIPAVLTGVELPAEHRMSFQDIAGRLKADALKLRAELQELSPREIGRRFDALQVHCDTCHQRFRVLPVFE